MLRTKASNLSMVSLLFHECAVVRPYVKTFVNPPLKSWMWWRKEGHCGAGNRESSRGGEKVSGWPKLWNDRGDGGRRRRRRKGESDGKTEKKEECGGVRRDHKKDGMGSWWTVHSSFKPQPE